MILSPDNDLTFAAEVLETDLDTLKSVPVVAGSVVAIITTSPASDAVKAHSTLETTCTYVATKKKWAVHFDASVLTRAVLNPIFGAGGVTPYCIIISPNNQRKVVTLEYQDYQEAIVT
jgi:hypothetical protein